MRFIGGKNLLIEEIELIIKENIKEDAKTFMDIFSGSVVVARNFKKNYEVYSNDLMYFSYVLQKATIENNKKPDFNKLKECLKVNNIFNYLENEKIDEHFKDKTQFFIFNNYSPNETNNRMYLTNKNAERIDFIRIKIEEWKIQELITENEYFYLLACLIESVPFYSNISGTYGAYFKYWDSRTLKDFNLVELEIINNNKKNKSFNIDANKLIKEIRGDILYLDPPYNSRQYLPNYHLLETIALYDSPIIKGVTGIRKYGESEKSEYCSKKSALKVFKDLIEYANFKYIILSYNNEGIMKEEEIEEVLESVSKNGSFVKKKINYRKYKGKKEHKIKEQLYELLYFIEKR